MVRNFPFPLWMKIISSASAFYRNSCAMIFLEQPTLVSLLTNIALRLSKKSSSGFNSNPFNNDLMFYQ
jgi:hypothetical protein